MDQLGAGVRIAGVGHDPVLFCSTRLDPERISGQTGQNFRSNRSNLSKFSQPFSKVDVLTVDIFPFADTRQVASFDPWPPASLAHVTASAEPHPDATAAPCRPRRNRKIAPSNPPCSCRVGVQSARAEKAWLARSAEYHASVLTLRSKLESSKWSNVF
jgi:hypothetical protein